MKRTEFKKRMQSLKSYRENNPGKGYWDWRNSLPDNLKYTNDLEYDMRSAYESGAQPKLEDDGLYHLPSRDPKSGRILKASTHPTYWKALEYDSKMGYNPCFINNTTYTWNDKDGPFIPWQQVEQFQNGGENVPMWLQQQYQGPQYYEILENLRRDDPEAYKRLQGITVTPRDTGVVYQDNARVGNATQAPVHRTNIEKRNELSFGPLGLLPVVGDVEEVANIALDTSEGNYGQAAAGLGLLALPGNVGKLFRKSKGLAVVHPNGLQRLFSPKRSKQLAEANRTRSFINDNKYDYVSYKDIRKAIDLTKDQDYLYRGVDKNAIHYKDLNTEENYSATAELIDQRDPKNSVLRFDKIPSRVTWTSKRPDYIHSQVDEIHFQPQQDFWFKAEQLPSNGNVRYLNSYDPNSRIVNTDGFNLNSGYHFVKIPKANSFAVMKEGVDYDTSNFNPIVDLPWYKRLFVSYANGGEVPPDNSPVRVNPITNRPLANGSIQSIFNLEDAANLTPIGDVLSIRDAYIAARNKDLLGLGLAGLGAIPFIPRLGRKKISKVDRPPIPEVNPNYFQEQMQKMEESMNKRKQLIDDFYNQQDQVYESLIENEDAFRRAANADATAGTNYVGTYGDYLKQYSEGSSRRNDNLPQIRLTDNIPSNTKAQVDPTNLDWISVNSRYSDPNEIDPIFRSLNPGLVRHELGHIIDEKSGLEYVRKLGKRSKFESEDKLKEMYPKSYKRIQDYLLNGSEIKSHMNEFREFLFKNGDYSPKETVKTIRQKLDKYGSSFRNLNILFDAYKNKSQFVRDYNGIPITSTDRDKLSV